MSYQVSIETAESWSPFAEKEVDPLAPEFWEFVNFTVTNNESQTTLSVTPSFTLGNGLVLEAGNCYSQGSGNDAVFSQAPPTVKAAPGDAVTLGVAVKNAGTLTSTQDVTVTMTVALTSASGTPGTASGSQSVDTAKKAKSNKN